MGGPTTAWGAFRRQADWQEALKKASDSGNPDVMQNTLKMAQQNVGNEDWFKTAWSPQVQGNVLNPDKLKKEAEANALAKQGPDMADSIIAKAGMSEQVRNLTKRSRQESFITGPGGLLANRSVNPLGRSLLGGG